MKLLTPTAISSAWFTFRSIVSCLLFLLKVKLYSLPKIRPIVSLYAANASNTASPPICPACSMYILLNATSNGSKFVPPPLFVPIPRLYNRLTSITSSGRVYSTTPAVVCIKITASSTLPLLN